jgi:small subunit ribosomal protein S16
VKLMVVRIRLMRMGSKRRPFYRFVVADSRGKRDGGFLDTVGHYNPIAQPEEIRVDENKIFDWLGKGAQISDGAHSLLKKIGIINRWNARRSGAELPPMKEPAAAVPEPEAKAAPVAAEAAAPAPETATAEPQEATAPGPETAPAAEAAAKEETAPEGESGPDEGPEKEVDEETEK